MRRLEARMAEQRLIAIGREAQRREGAFDVDMTRPQPCVRWLDARAQDKEERLVFCLKKLAEEHEEVWEAYGEYVSHNSGAREHLAEELTDVITAVTTMLCAFGYNEVARSDVQKQVNRKNRARGYW